MELPVYKHKLDVVFVVENSRDLLPAADKIRKLIIDTPTKLKNSWGERYSALGATTVRAKLISFSDYAYDGADAIRTTDFFDIDDQRDAFLSAVDALPFTRKNNGAPQNGLEALYTAINSDWRKFVIGRDYGRSIIIVISNSPPLRLQERANHPDYPAKIMPKTFDELEAVWDWEDRRSSAIDPVRKRAVFVVPKNASDSSEHTWSDALDWNQSIIFHCDFKNFDEETRQVFLDDIIFELVADV